MNIKQWISLVAALLLGSTCPFYSAPANAAAAPVKIVGNFDGLRNDISDAVRAKGWTCVQGNPAALTTTLYAGNPASGGVAIASIAANSTIGSDAESAAIANVCGTSTQHRFSLALTPSQLSQLYGQTLYVASTYGATTTVLPGSVVVPVAAGAAQNVNQIAGFNLLVDCSVADGVNCSAGGNASMTGAGGASSYAYAASIVNDGQKYNMFMCSAGINGGWDAIRYSTSTDRVHWTTPIVKLATTGAANRDYSACDPSVVFFDGFYYMFYGSAYTSPKGNTQTVIQVARAPTIDGEYSILSQAGLWGASQSDPPAMIIKPAQDVQAYGAGQPSVVVAGNELIMWYSDDTVDFPARHDGNILMVTSTDGMNWSKPVLTNAGTLNVDVKFDPTNNQFVMFGLPMISGQLPIQARTSTDGLHWTQPQTMSGVAANPVPFCAQNIGVSGDIHGNQDQNGLLITYMAPFVSQLTTAAGKDLTCNATRPEWNLYGVFGALNR